MQDFETWNISLSFTYQKKSIKKIDSTTTSHYILIFQFKSQTNSKNGYDRFSSELVFRINIHFDNFDIFSTKTTNCVITWIAISKCTSWWKQKQRCLLGLGFFFWSPRIFIPQHIYSSFIFQNSSSLLQSRYSIKNNQNIFRQNHHLQLNKNLFKHRSYQQKSLINSRLKQPSTKKPTNITIQNSDPALKVLSLSWISWLKVSCI